MDANEATTFLKDRATSYWRDAVKMEADEDLKSMAIAYKAISRELRDCAAKIQEAE